MLSPVDVVMWVLQHNKQISIKQKRNSEDNIWELGAISSYLVLIDANYHKEFVKAPKVYQRKLREVFKKKSVYSR